VSGIVHDTEATGEVCRALSTEGEGCGLGSPFKATELNISDSVEPDLWPQVEVRLPEPKQHPLSEQHLPGLDEDGIFRLCIHTDAIILERKLLETPFSEERHSILIGEDDVIEPESILIVEGIEGIDGNFAEAMFGIAFRAEQEEVAESELQPGFRSRGEDRVDEVLGLSGVGVSMNELVDVSIEQPAFFLFAVLVLFDRLFWRGCGLRGGGAWADGCCDDTEHRCNYQRPEVSGL